MLSEAYELFGCNTADLYVISVNTGDTDAECIQFDLTYGVEFPCISGVEGGGTAINNTYNIGAYPTYILIAPDKSIVEQDIWPVLSTQTFIDVFESHNLQQAECGGVLTAGFSSDVTELCQYNAVNFTDNSLGDVTGWSWTFEGGDPATSTEANPVVTYNETGTFNVELEVTDGTNTSNMMLEDYITVNMTPPAMLNAFEDVCLGWPAFELTGGSPAGGVYAGPGVEDGMFYPDVAGLGTHTVTYTYTASNDCSNTAESTILVDPCTGINQPLSKVVNIYPNPTKGLVELAISQEGTMQVEVYDISGKTIYKESINVHGTCSSQIDLSGYEAGLYFLSIQSKNENLVRKINLIK